MRTIAMALICSMFAVGPAAAQDKPKGLSPRGGLSPQVEADAWKEVAAAIPLGSKVKLQTVDGKRWTGTLMNLSADSVLVKRNSRLPEPAVSVAFSDIARLERDHGSGINVGKAMSIGLASGAGMLLALFAIALQFD